jgi:hypothetical protein
LDGTNSGYDHYAKQGRYTASDGIEDNPVNRKVQNMLKWCCNTYIARAVLGGLELPVLVFELLGVLVAAVTTSEPVVVMVNLEACRTA